MSNNGRIITPGGSQQLRCREIEETSDVARANILLNKTDWSLMNMAPNTAPAVDEGKIIYVFGRFTA